MWEGWGRGYSTSHQSFHPEVEGSLSKSTRLEDEVAASISMTTWTWIRRRNVGQQRPRLQGHTLTHTKNTSSLHRN